MRRLLILPLIVMPIQTGLSGSPVAANGVPTLDTTSVTYADTAALDSFSDVNGTITGLSANPRDSALVDGINAVNPPNTAAIVYSKMVVGTYGTMYIGQETDSNSNVSDVFAYVVDSGAVNALTNGTDTETFTFDADGATSTTADRATFTVTVTGANETPIIGTVTPDFTEGVTASNVSYSVGSHPPAEAPIKAFDDSTSTKYLNYTEVGADLRVDVGAQYVLTGLGLTTANDSPDRDPTKIRIYGSSTSFNDLVEIGSEITLTLPSGSPTPRQSDYENVSFDNSTAYRYYRIEFTAVADVSTAQVMQIAEVRLAGIAAADFPRFTLGEDATPFAAGVTLTDESTTGITATISTNIASGDVLACPACATNNISAAWSSPTLSLTASGTPSQANWQAALQSLTFHRTAAGATDNPTVRLSASDGTTTGSSDLEILVTQLAPEIAVPAASVLAGKGVELEPIVPTNDSSPGTWTISPALPAGLSLDAATGRITGTPTATLAATEYTLTATNSSGSDTVAFTLTITDLPAAPTALSAAAGDASATISFTAGDDGGSAIANYEYSTDGGSTWTALDPADTESPITIAGLTNGTAASITIRAVSAAGPGTASEAVSVTPIAPATTTTASTTASTTTTTVLAPQRDGAGVLPQVTDATKGLIITDGVTSEVDVAVVEQRQLVLRGEGFEMALAGTATAGQPAMIGESGRLQIDPNGVIGVTGSGFDPESTVDVWIMSDPVYLGSVTVDADGTFAASLAVPSDLPLGNHTVQANGVTTGGVSRSLNLGIEVVTDMVLPSTGGGSSIPIAALLTALGLFIAVATRRRGTTPSSA